MTVTAARPYPDVRESSPGSSPPTVSAVRAASTGLTLLGVVVLGFLGYLFLLSGLQEGRAQATGYATLRAELGQQVAPLGPVAPGAAVAILNIPAIGIKNMIVVEGTSPENLELGPGHLRDSPLPGQYGVAEIFGRSSTFGAPFGHLGQLRRGDHLTVITGQGTASYTVMAAGDSTHLVEDPAPNRLLLVTGCPGPVPTSYCYFDADLTSAPKPDPGGRPLITAQEEPLSGDTGALVLTLLWGLALLVVSALATLAAAKWPPLLAYLAAVPPILAVLWNLYQSLAALLPNVY